MKNNFATNLPWAVMVSVFVFYSQSNFAALGEKSQNLIQPQKSTKDVSSKQSTTQHANHNYSVHDSTLSTGTVVREFADTDGIVFGVAWSGPKKPTLSDLLGKYFPKMQELQADHVHVGQPFTNINTSDFVVESFGRMRWYMGRAYLPNKLPVGLKQEDINWP